VPQFFSPSFKMAIYRSTVGPVRQIHKALKARRIERINCYNSVITEIATIQVMTNQMAGQFARDIDEGLSASPKFLSSRYFYDAKGDKIFQAIMKMPE